MQIEPFITTPKPPNEFDKHLADELNKYTRDLGKILNKGLKFVDNFNAQVKSLTSNATPDTEETVAHTLGRVPSGYLVLYRSKAGVLYQGPSTGTAWTATSIYVKSNVASTVYSILIF
jgi:hypothetical protein